MQTQNRHHAGRSERHRLGGDPQGPFRPAHDGALHARRLRFAHGGGLLPKYAGRHRTGGVQHRARGTRRPPRQGQPGRMRGGRAAGAGQGFAPGRTRCGRSAAHGDAGFEGRDARRHRHGSLQQGERTGRGFQLHGPHRILRGGAGRGADDDPVQRRAARGAGHQAYPRVGDQPQHFQGEDRARPAHAAPLAHRGFRHRRAAHRRDGAQPPRRGRRAARPSTTASWPCTTTRGWRRSRRSRPTA